MTVFLCRKEIDRGENRNCDSLENNRGRRLEWLNHVIAVSRPILSYARPGLTSNTRSSDVTHLGIADKGPHADSAGSPCQIL